MITAIVRFKLPPTVQLKDAAELFKGTAPKYRQLPGLVRKYYLFDSDTGIGGGVYLWESREAADRVYTKEWKQTLAQRYGAEPEISYFDTPVVVDNAIDEIRVDAAE
jgi:hypothetical protein